MQVKDKKKHWMKNICWQKNKYGRNINFQFETVAGSIWELPWDTIILLRTMGGRFVLLVYQWKELLEPCLFGSGLNYILH